MVWRLVALLVLLAGVSVSYDLVDFLFGGWFLECVSLLYCL